MNESIYVRNLPRRRRVAMLWRLFFMLSIGISLLMLTLLLYSITEQAFTWVAVENSVEPDTLTNARPLNDLSELELVEILEANLSKNRLRVLILQYVLGAPEDTWGELNTRKVSEILASSQYPAEIGGIYFKDLTLEESASILREGLARHELLDIIVKEIVSPTVVDSWTLSEFLLNKDEIKAELVNTHPKADLRFHTWVNWNFLTDAMSSRPELSGLRTAILGSIWMMAITVIFAFPIGIGAAIYLEEYAGNSWITKIIRINITNLAGVPSILYGILGLVISVRALGSITQGRTILSAGLTMGLLILPIVIINTQEAIRAVPDSLREASKGMGATKWYTVRSVVLPSAMPGILTGTILAMSRALGETAPLIVVGSITRITIDPSGPLSRFTVVPIQIYTWTAQPQDEFRSIAAAAIIVLLAILLLANSLAIVARNVIRSRR